MSDEVIRNAAKSFPARTSLPWLVAAGVYALLLMLGPRLLNDPDSFSHIAVGRWIMAQGAVPASDPFSFSMHGAPWIAFNGCRKSFTRRYMRFPDGPAWWRWRQ